MKRICLMLYMIAIVGLILTSCGGGSGGGTSTVTPTGTLTGDCTGVCRIKKVVATTNGSGKKVSLFKSKVAMMKTPAIDLGEAGEYIATFNDIEGSADEGKIIEVHNTTNGTWFKYDYSVSKQTTKTWYSDATTVSHVTVFKYETPGTDSDTTFTDMIEYQADGTTFISFVRIRQEYVNSAWRIEEICEYPSLISSTVLNRAVYTYYDGSNDIYSIQYDEGVVTAYKYYTKPVVTVEDITVVTEVETTIDIVNADTSAEITEVNTVETDSDGLVVTTENNTGEAVVIPVDNTTTATDTTTPAEVTTPVVVDYDYTYEQGTSEDTNWFRTFYKEVYPFE